MEVNIKGKGLYSPKIAARIARIRPQHFQAWAKANLVHPIFQIQFGKRTENIYSYYDLLLIRLIKRLRDKGFRTKVIKKALDTISIMSGGDPYAWTKATICIDANVIVALLPGKPEWNPIAASKGPQKMEVVFFPELIEELKKELVPNRFRYVEVNPDVLGGSPVVKGTRIPTTIIRSMEKQGQDPKQAYPDLTDAQIKGAVAYEEFLVAA
ncbi:MAG: DUF433 domain-containing protein [Chloroflexota bacterium]